MYFIQDEKELIGKTIAYANAARFGNRILIITSDKGIFGVSSIIYDEDDDPEIYIYKPYEMESYVVEHFDKVLKPLGLITQEDIDNYKKKKDIERQEYLKKCEIEKAEREKRQYEELKKKFEN